MKKNILFYIICLGLLGLSFFFFINTYRQIAQYATLTNRSNIVYGSFQKLSSQVNNAAVLHPDLVKAGRAFAGQILFYTDSLAVTRQLALLEATVKDTVNIKIAARLGILIRAELPWLINSNVPDSILLHQSTLHIVKLQLIDSLIEAGINRTDFLVTYHNNKLKKAITGQIVWMLLFITVSIIMILYTGFNLYRQRSETKKKEHELEIVFNRISDAVVSVDSNWRYTFLNDAALAAYTKERDEILGKVIWDLHPEMKDTIFWEKYHLAMQTKEVTDIETYYQPIDTWFSVKVYPADNGLTIFYKDISALKKSGQQLSRTVKEVNDYKFALDETSIVAITDQKGIIKYVNENFCKISKYTSEELIGQDHRIINSGFHPKEFIRNLWTTIAHGKIWKGELKNKAKDGTIYWVDTTIVPFLDDHGKPYQYVAIRADITERKRSEAYMTALNESLQNQTKELARSNAELEQFAYVASHDMQEPLRMVSSFLTQLEKKYAGIIDEKGKIYISFAVDGAKRMRQIILDLLEFSRVGKTEENKEDIDINDLIQEIKMLFRKQIEDKHALIEASGLPVIHAHKVPVYQVFQNLLSNALKYAAADRPGNISISFEDQQTHWQFMVADNGIGINEQFFDKIFIIFQRLHNKDDYAGTGMGLAITKKIVDNLGGKIWVTSTEGKGSTFYFTIKK